MEQARNQIDITTRLLNWYNINKRDLPWRESTDPYRIWLSEVILQQTRIIQGWDYYLRFTDRFPDVQSLAKAEEEEVLKLWQGLGYYTRARNLHAAAKQIMSQFKGVFPSEYSDILSLKGVGTYTAAAISSIAFNAPYAVIDGNVNRVITRLFAVKDPIDTAAGKKNISEIAHALLPYGQSGKYNQAIMDFGSLVCTPAGPKCADCPLQVNCRAFEEKNVFTYPVTRRKPVVRKRYFSYFHIIQGNKTFLQKRNADDIWRNLYEFPLIETPEAIDFPEISQTENFLHLFPNNMKLSVDHFLTLKHQLTHQTIHATFYRVEIEEGIAFNQPQKFTCIDRNNLADYPVSRLIDKYLEKIR